MTHTTETSQTSSVSSQPRASSSAPPVVGDLDLSFNRLELPADHGLTIFTYTAEPGSRSDEALKLLGSWAATADSAESASTTDQS